ncbi:hypothetical protein ABZZ74_49055 [Streptomyces sp. NPDC006476]|uniref:hypothetical protein n=1 Tax=Streptomyces sp. NPDC006476 TaxID=3157175 RepID=UPI0033B0A103
MHWLVAATEYGALTAVYCAVPDFPTPRKAVTVVERGAFRHARGWVFLDRLPDLAGRWKSGPLQRLSATPAKILNSPPQAAFRDQFAAMSGTRRGLRCTVADDFEPVPFTPFRTRQQHHVAVFAVHLGTGFPSIRVALRGTGGWRSVHP